jgi:hypothetical protein
MQGGQRGLRDALIKENLIKSVRPELVETCPEFSGCNPRPIADTKPLELLKMLRRIEERGAIESAHRVGKAEWAEIDLDKVDML